MRLLTFIFLLTLFGCSSPIDINSVELRPNGLTYYKRTNNLVNGLVTRKFENGRVAEEVTYKSGKQIGKWSTYDYNGDDFTHGYGFDLDKQIIIENKKANLSNVTVSVNVEGNYQYASVALPETFADISISELLNLRNAIFNQYSEKHHFTDIFINYKRKEYRFLNTNYSTDLSLDTVKSNENTIINVR
jgi:hypothetical protein